MPLEKRDLSSITTNDAPTAEIQPASKAPQGTSECSRCIELGIPSLLVSLGRPINRAQGEDTSAIFVQRLIVDPSKSISLDCTSCSTLDQVTNYWVRLKAPRLQQLGPWAKDTWETSWFQREGRWIFRCTSEKHDMLSIGLPDSEGHLHWRCEAFGPLRPSGSRLQDNDVRRVMARPNYNTIDEWLSYCSQNHPRCQPQCSSGLRSITLLDVHTRRLVQYPSADGQGCDYIALSYVWGSTPQQTISKTKALPENLPRTISNAMTAVNELGKRYLWVDSICIDQSNLTEKSNQIELMDLIYQGAFATIVALDGTDADSGLPGVDREAERNPQMFVDFGDTRLVSKLPTLDEQLKYSPWMHRAWTYQEALLSQRLLIFTKYQTYFVCNELECCESRHDPEGFVQDRKSGPHPLRDPLVDQQYRVYDEKISLYSRVISNYASRNVTKDSDSLNAVSALLRQMQKKVFPEGFFYGLPIVRFRQSLLWLQEVPERLQLVRDARQRARRRADAGFPSWSWAAWKLEGGIYYLVGSDDAKQQRLQPPLRVRTREGQEIPLDIQTEDEATPHENWSDENESEETEEIIADVRGLYQRLHSQSQAETPISSRLPRQCNIEISDIAASSLDITGILLTLPVTITDVSLWPGERGKAPKFSLPDQLNGDERISVFWHIEGEYSFVATEGEDRSNDFLLVSVEWLTYTQRFKLEMILLNWEEGIASRRGVVMFWINGDLLRDLFKYANARLARFWLE